ncbi:MAG: DNA/RNA non-specific endonuclease [Chitinophagaceae bacterium]|nr:DNA/RNA non-specific endonuclease [Chitinophagaceae bacterium]
MKRIFIVLVCTLFLFTSCKKGGGVTPPPPPPPPTPVTDNDPLLPGNPTNATGSSSNVDNYLKDNTYYKISYSSTRGTSNWVAWHLQSEDLGSVPRSNNFRGDALLPGAWYQVQNEDYNGSGFDRGHMCPSGDRTATTAGNSATFLMTNIFPQAPNLNQGPWEGLETFIRDNLVGTGNEAFVYVGVTGSGGYGLNGTTSFLAGGRITVPSKAWKVVLVIPKGNGDLARIHSDATVLAVNIPNDNRLFNTSPSGKNDWRNYLVSVNSIETDAQSAGIPLNLFSAINDSIKVNLKSKIYH